MASRERLTVAVLSAPRSGRQTRRDFSPTDHQKRFANTVRQFIEAESAPVREGMVEGREIPARPSETRRNGLLCGMLFPTNGRGRARYRFVSLISKKWRGFYGDLHGAGGDEFGGASAAAAFWHDAEDKIFAAHSYRRKRSERFASEPAQASDPR